jgi:hypothetical protein
MGGWLISNGRCCMYSCLFRGCCPASTACHNILVKDTFKYPNPSGLTASNSGAQASTFNIEILERFQSKALRIIVDAPWYVPNNHIRRNLQMTSVKEDICSSSNQYFTRFTTHPNDQILTLMEIPGNRRLRRHVPNDLPGRFLL